MMAQAMIPTASMEAYARVLLARSSRWARGVDLKTGRQFVTFTSSRTTKDGQPIYHRTAIDGSGCCCPGYLYRGMCSHALACRWDTEQAHESAARPPVTYENLYGLDEAF